MMTACEKEKQGELVEESLDAFAKDKRGRGRLKEEGSGK
jgi:hypothetical protein